ncbi:unnamed protein product, partial [Discosporangium mesarthrocarpum]
RAEPAFTLRESPVRRSNAESAEITVRNTRPVSPKVTERKGCESVGRGCREKKWGSREHTQNISRHCIMGRHRQAAAVAYGFQVVSGGQGASGLLHVRGGGYTAWVDGVQDLQRGKGLYKPGGDFAGGLGGGGDTGVAEARDRGGGWRHHCPQGPQGGAPGPCMDCRITTGKFSGALFNAMPGIAQELPPCPLDPAPGQKRGGSRHGGKGEG